MVNNLTLLTKTLQIVAAAHKEDKKLVLATGVFDLLHEEHKRFLQKAKDIGQVLIVGVETDQRVKELKGANRPIWNQDKRTTELEQLDFVDHVFLLPEQFSTPQDHENLISQIKPDFLAVSSHTLHLDKKQKLLRKYGGEVRVVHRHNPAISTTIQLGQTQN